MPELDYYLVGHTHNCHNWLSESSKVGTKQHPVSERPKVTNYYLNDGLFPLPRIYRFTFNIPQ